MELKEAEEMVFNACVTFDIEKEKRTGIKREYKGSYEEAHDVMSDTILELKKENEELREINKMIEAFPVDSMSNDIKFILITKENFLTNPCYKNLLDNYISKDKIKEKIAEYREKYKNENSEYVKERWGDRILALDDLLRIY
jgi:hypothetical protein